MTTSNDPVVQRSCSRISRLPFAIRQQLNLKLRDNRELRYIAEWLFAQVAPEDLPELGLKQGEPFSKAFAELQDPLVTVGAYVSRYRYSRMYRSWLEEEKRNGLIGGLVSNMEAATAVARDVKDGSRGVSNIALSMVVEKMEGMTKSENVDVADIKDLAGVIAKISAVQLAAEKAALEREKLELLKAKVESERAAKQKPKLTPEEKERRMREIFGIRQEPGK